MFDLGWGEPVCVRETLGLFYTPKFLPESLSSMGYPHHGKPELIEALKNLLGYKYVIITNGTTSSINIVLRVLAHEGRDICVTEKHHYPFYPQIIEKSGYRHKTGLLTNNSRNWDKVILADVPSNPWGKIYSVDNSHNNVIWDSVYANKVYINNKMGYVIDHRVNVGSFSKMLGLTGLRIGWIATNNKDDFENFQKENLFENMGISVPSQDLILDILKKVDLSTFCDTARARVNINRDEFQKISVFFDNQEIPTNGMFFPVWVGESGIKIIERAGVQYIVLDKDGNSTLIRFNLAQNNQVTQAAVKAIRTADRLK